MICEASIEPKTNHIPYYQVLALQPAQRRRIAPVVPVALVRAEGDGAEESGKNKRSAFADLLWKEKGRYCSAPGLFSSAIDIVSDFSAFVNR